MTEQTGEMSPDRISAIIYTIRIGSLLVNDHPEIADAYRAGMSLTEIAKELDIKGNYGVTDGIARGSVHYAITGYTRGIHTEPYDGLIQDLDELARLGHEHSVKCGIIEGRKLAELGLGIHSFTEEERKEAARKAVEGRGQTLWIKKEGTRHLYDETVFANLLSLEPEFQKGSRVNNIKIAGELNARYHGGEEIRSAGAVAQNQDRYKKSLGK